jgi:hypothetical protein
MRPRKLTRLRGFESVVKFIMEERTALFWRFFRVAAVLTFPRCRDL